MSLPASRRDFLATVSLGGTAALSGLINHLPRVSAQEAALPSDVVAFDPAIEPIVRLIEETPREKLLEAVGQRLRAGMSYQQTLTALLLAGIRNVQPRPSVGFKFHSVLVINSCHLASLAGPDEDRWLPIFWALDYFKVAQADEARSTGWRMPAVSQTRVPASHAARDEFRAAMEAWDVERADAAAAGLVRACGATDVFNLFAEYAARDFRSIGHKAIYLANAWRTLQVIGWRHAEPVFRSLTFALLNHTNEPNPASSDLAPDRPWRANLTLVENVPETWRSGRLDATATKDMIALFRQSSPLETATATVELLKGGVSPQSVWDSIFVSAGELLMRQPGIVGLHGLTTANAMRFLWENVADDTLRIRLLLQASSFNPLFRESAIRRAPLRDLTIDQLFQPKDDQPASPELDAILAAISNNPLDAAQLVSRYVEQEGHSRQFMDATRQMIFLKGRDSHDYKFSSAVLEDAPQISPAWRNTFLGLSVFHLKGTGDQDSGLLERTRAALA